MIGAIVGDIAGSIYERTGLKVRDFEFLSKDCCFTDDTVLTIAVARALLESHSTQFTNLGELVIKYMKQYSGYCPIKRFGGGFRYWLNSENPEPYQSIGNGAAMRISPVAYVAKSLDEVKVLSKRVTGVTHNSEEGYTGAESIAVATWLALHGAEKKQIKEEMEKYYSLDFTLDEIRPTYDFNATCLGSVPQSIVAFLESNSFEDAIRGAISIGGDTDTIAAMAGSIAEAYYGVPEKFREKALTFLHEDFLPIIHDFEKEFPVKL